MSAPTLRPGVFLDRDGVLNEVIVRDGKALPPPSVGELRIVEEADAALRGLKAKGFALVGVTNQPDVARGTQRREVVEAINAVLLAALPLEGIYVCYHDDADRCACRKPQPGLLIEAARERHIDLSRSVMIGDRWRDIEAGRRAGCVTIHLAGNHAEESPTVSPDYRTRSLLDAATWIVNHCAPRGGRA
ncbi:MAG TPA: HAD-IIIA family hydrolase [bacterium]|nr:HAD-IIIA family hydrolase [bacterium]